MHRVQRGADIRLYSQVTQTLRQRILDGYWKSGDKIPTEDQLCELCDVSRITVRRALLQLESDGLLYRVQGSGTYVARPQYLQEIGKRYGVFDAMSPRLASSAQLIAVEEKRLPHWASLLLDVQPQERQAWQVTVQYSVQKEPFCIAFHYLPKSVFPMIPQADKSGQWIEQILFDMMNNKPSQTQEIIGAANLGRSDARHLKTHINAAVMQVDRVDILQDKKIHLCRSLILADRFAFVTNLTK